MQFHWVRVFRHSLPWTVPSYIAWPTALHHRLLAHWITALIFYRLGLGNRINKRQRKFLNTISGQRCIFNRGSGACCPGARWLGSRRESDWKKYGAGPERWWSWSRPVTEATRELRGIRCSHRPRAGTKRAWDCSRPSLWPYCRRRRTGFWIWKLWALSPESLLLASTCHTDLHALSLAC